MLVYEDPVAKIVLAGKCSNGHLQITPIKKAKHLHDLSDEEVEHLFKLASLSATLLFEGLGAQGTNIITNETDNFSIDIIARSQEDGLNFLWEPKQLSPQDVESVFSQIKDKADFIGHTPTEDSSEPAPKQQQKIETDNYLTKHLERSP